jgi:hypothetical protein
MDNRKRCDRNGAAARWQSWQELENLSFDKVPDWVEEVLTSAYAVADAPKDFVIRCRKAAQSAVDGNALPTTKPSGCV